MNYNIIIHKILIILLIFSEIIIGVEKAYSQTKTKLQKAEEAYENKDFILAREYYEKILKKGKKYKKIEGEIYFKIGETYRLANDYENAIKSYASAIRAGYEKPELYKNYAYCLISICNYVEAKTNLEKYLNMQQDEFAKLQLKSLDFAIKNEKNNPVWNVINEKKLNSKFSDWGIIPIKDFYIFVSSRGTKESKIYQYTGQAYSDFYELRKTGNAFAKPKLCKGGINSPFNDGSAHFDPQTQTLYFMQCNGIKGKDYNCNIYSSTLDKKGKNWQDAKLFEFNSTEYSIGHPTFTKDMRTMYFVSDMPGGKGGKDIWVIRKIGNKWSDPQNIGHPINTIGDEMFPFLYNDTILYFSSNGHPGFGGLDIFKSVYSGEKFSTPENLMPPINSCGDDFSIYFTSRDSGYFSSNRPGGVGDDDIYSFAAINIEINIVGQVLDDKTEKPLEKAIVIIKGTDGSIDSTVTDKNGNFRFKKIKRDIDYQLIASRFGYLKNSTFATTKNIDITKDTTLGKDNTVKVRKKIYLSEITKEEIVINDIYYDYNKWTLRDSSKIELDKIVKLLNENPEINIMLNSHTDERGNDNYNMKLSTNRAKACVDYLIEKGIDPERLAFKGWGETKLLIKNAKTEEEHQKNRRTTFTILNVEELKSLKKSQEYAQMAEYLQSRKIQKEKEDATTKSTQQQMKLGFDIVASTSSSAAEHGVSFRVQFTAPSKPMDKKEQEALEKKFSKHNYNIEFTIDSKKTYRYTIGDVYTYEDAIKLKEQMVALGYKDSFIIAYKDDNVISINDAKKIIENSKKQNPQRQ